jgi:hypothetical protein
MPLKFISYKFDSIYQLSQMPGLQLPNEFFLLNSELKSVKTVGFSQTLNFSLIVIDNHHLVTQNYGIVKKNKKKY